MYIDFKELKQRVSVEDVVEMLGLNLAQSGEDNQYRGSCPRCDDGGDRALVVTPGRGYYCFSAKAGGDCIALAAHILDLPMKDAALHIVERADDELERKPKPEQKKEPETEKPDAEPLQPLTYLRHKHDAVQALGIDADIAESLGIGYARKGIMRGRVAIPIREDDGTLVGYCGFCEGADPPLKLPKNFDPS
jgi:DNA primase